MEDHFKCCHIFSCGESLSKFNQCGYSDNACDYGCEECEYNGNFEEFLHCDRCIHKSDRDGWTERESSYY